MERYDVYIELDDKEKEVYNERAEMARKKVDESYG